MADENIGGNPANFMAPLTRSHIMLPLYNGAAGDGTTGNGGGAAGDAGAGGGQAQAGAGAAPGDKGGAQAGAGQGGGGEKVFTYKEDRTDWVPRTRLNEESGKRTKLETDYAALKTQLENEQKRVRAALGIETPTKEQEDEVAVRQAIERMYPQLKVFEGLTPEHIAAVLQAAESANATTQHQWERHASSMLTELETEAAKGLGIDKLTPTQQRNLRRAYRDEAEMALQARGTDEQGRPLPDATGKDFLTRHEAGDKTLIREFVTAFLNDWLEPAKRQVTTVEARRFRPTPRGERTVQLPNGGGEKLDLNKNSDFQKALLAARGQQ